MTETAATVLVVEDDPSIRTGLKVTLELEGFSVDEAVNGTQALAILQTWIPDLVLLDLMLPGMSGFDLCRRIRELHGDRVLILMLTARSDEASKVAGLTLGADDYVTKPFGVAELVARLRRLLHRRLPSRGPSDRSVVCWGRVRIDFKCFRCTVDDQSVELSTREYEILRDFAAHPHEVVSREDLLERVWGYSPDNLPSTRTVDNFIVRLRQKLEEDPTNPRLITSVRGAGYRLEPPGIEARG